MEARISKRSVLSKDKVMQKHAVGPLYFIFWLKK